MTAFQASSYTVSSTCTAAPLCHLRPTLINSFQVSLNVYLKEVQIYFFIRIIRTTGTNPHLNILTHFLWEGPTESRHPSLCTAVVVCTTSMTIPQRVFKGDSTVVLPSTCDSRLAIIVHSNKGRGIAARILGTGTVVTTNIVVVIRESTGVCPNMSTRVPICDGDTINVVGVDAICSIKKQRVNSTGSPLLVHKHSCKENCMWNIQPKYSHLH